MMPFEDRYDDPRKAGSVVGSATSTGVTRGGADVESVLSIDGEGLRVEPLFESGWGRSGIVYGPFERRDGLALMVHVLNGHNASRVSNIPDSFPRRLMRWLIGSGACHPCLRVLRWLKVGRKRGLWKSVRFWFKISRKAHRDAVLDTNLAVGWFSESASMQPLDSGNLLAIHSTGADNGELRLRCCGGMASMFPSLQNVPLYLMIVLRKTGAVYYAATLPGVPGLAAYPKMQVIGINPEASESPLHGGFYQSVLGEIGFRVSTRVFGVKASPVAEFENWYGSAHAADSLEGASGLDSQSAEVGGAWTIHRGGFSRSEAGAVALQGESLATLNPLAPSGLIHAQVVLSGDAVDAVGLVWRFQDADNHYRLMLRRGSCELGIVEAGEARRLQIAELPDRTRGSEHSLQMIDAGPWVRVLVDGVALFGGQIDVERFQANVGIGIHILDTSGASRIRFFEAHPREIKVPEPVRMPPLAVRSGTRTMMFDDFKDRPGRLDGVRPSIGEDAWERIFGRGTFLLTGGRCVVDASREHPNPGRTAYVLKWKEVDFADIAVEITPPGGKRGEGEQGRSGLVFYQDPDNYIIINTWLDDQMDGASISSFFQIKGFEEIYDAVWTNVGHRIEFGAPYHLRVTFDGLVYTAFVNNEPVLYRSLRDVYPGAARLKITRVGIVANWEWGNDTGSAFNNFTARAEPAASR